jgi:hypothetical protein
MKSADGRTGAHNGMWVDPNCFKQDVDTVMHIAAEKASAARK